jgi:hypothetical protein
MYVRWRMRRLIRSSPGVQALRGLLVETRRLRGRPRQRTVAYLGTVQVWENGFGQVAIGGGGRAYEWQVPGFWDRVSRKLDDLEEPFDRDAVEAMIAARVPRPGATGS